MVGKLCEIMVDSIGREEIKEHIANKIIEMTQSNNTDCKCKMAITTIQL